MKRIFLSITLFLATIHASAKTLAEFENQLFIALGVQTAKIYCPAQSKPYALYHLDKIDPEACGIGPMDSVYRAREEMPLDSIPTTVTFWWESKKIPSQKKCNLQNGELSSLIKMSNQKSLQQCSLIGNSKCDSLPVEFYFTSDKYCVVINKTRPSNGSSNAEVQKLLTAKNKLTQAMTMYQSIPCDHQAAYALVNEAKALISSAQPTESSNPAYNGSCLILDN